MRTRKELQPFRFKRFQVRHERSAMKVGTDGVLLGAWCPADDARRVLDVGTGCGLIALMVAQRTPQAQIIAVDIDAESAAEAGTNFLTSPWAGRLRAVCVDFNEMAFTPRSFDLIVSNPPFFINSLPAPDAARSLARHAQSLSLSQLLGRSTELLKPDGVLSMITPSDLAPLVTEQAALASLHVVRRCDVMSAAGGEKKRTLWNLSPCCSGCAVETLCITDAEGHYTDDYKALTCDFYLNF